MRSMARSVVRAVVRLTVRSLMRSAGIYVSVLPVYVGTCPCAYGPLSTCHLSSPSNTHHALKKQ